MIVRRYTFAELGYTRLNPLINIHLAVVTAQLILVLESKNMKAAFQERTSLTASDTSTLATSSDSTLFSDTIINVVPDSFAECTILAPEGRGIVISKRKARATLEVDRTPNSLDEHISSLVYI